MTTNRLTLLHQFYEEDPTDPFNGYALALEYVNQNPEQAQFYFDQLLTNHANYLPTYYHAAALYAELQQPQQAQVLYKKGMELAQNQQQIRTFQELQRALRALEDENEW
jgi:tetratricopeptide (TPR) repeat protein